MALDINGYNATFKAFVNFALHREAANDGKAVINAHVNKLGGRKVIGQR